MLCRVGPFTLSWQFVTSPDVLHEVVDCFWSWSSFSKLKRERAD